MDNTEILDLVALEIGSSIDDSIYGNEGYREKARNYYLGVEPANAKKGRSSVITTEVRDTIETALPQIHEVFNGENDADFQPNSSDQMESSISATKFTKYVINTENQGFIIKNTWFKDALLYNLGIVKSYWNTEETFVGLMSAEGLSEDQLAYFSSQPHIEIQNVDTIESALNPDFVTYNVDYNERTEKSFIKIDNIPIDEFYYSSDAKFDPRTGGISASTVGHRRKITEQELITSGFDADLVDQIPTAQDALTNDERSRQGLIKQSESLREVYVCETYKKLDLNESNELRMYKIVSGGERGDVVILDIEEWDWLPFSALTPVPLSHQLAGLSLYDLARQSQDAGTSVTRMMLDSLYYSSSPRMIVSKGVNMKDVMNSNFGAPIRADSPGSDVLPMKMPFIGAESLGILGFLNSKLETTTGVGKTSQGINADSLSNTSAAHAAIAETTEVKRMELIARVFAETGIKHLYKTVLMLGKKHGTGEQLIQNDGKYSEVNPSEFDVSMNLAINVGIGSQNKRNRVTTFAQIIASQEKIMQVQGIDGPMVTQKEYYNAITEMAKAADIVGVDRFYKNPADYKPDPNQKPQLDQNSQAFMQVEQMKIEFKREEAANKLKFERDKFDRTEALKIEELRLKNDLDRLDVGGDDISLQILRNMNGV